MEGLGDDRLSLAADNKDIALEDQVDVTLFTTVDAVIEFLSHPNQLKFVKYPPSLFRIVTNRRLFVGADGLCCRMSRNTNWRSAFPATLVFHGAVHDGLHELAGRPNLVISQVAADCEAFVSFQSVRAEVQRSTKAAAVVSHAVVLKSAVFLMLLLQSLVFSPHSRTWSDMVRFFGRFSPVYRPVALPWMVCCSFVFNRLMAVVGICLLFVAGAHGQPAKLSSQFQNDISCLVPDGHVISFVPGSSEFCLKQLVPSPKLSRHRDEMCLKT